MIKSLSYKTHNPKLEGLNPAPAGFNAFKKSEKKLWKEIGIVFQRDFLCC